MFPTQPRQRLRRSFLKITSACWSTRERMNPGSFKTSFWVFDLLVIINLWICLTSPALLFGYAGKICACAGIELGETCFIPLTDLKPKGVVVNMIPGLPASILFMCIRHADYLNDEAKLKSLMNAIIDAVKKVILVRSILSLLAFSQKLFFRSLLVGWQLFSFRSLFKFLILMSGKG